MKIAFIATGVLEIPPKNWGAIEKIIWNLSNFFKSLGHSVDIIDLNNICLLNNYYDIVHVFIENQANELARLGIPYFFSMCDHHAYIYGKESSCYLNNLSAIKSSIITTFPAEYLLEYFDFQVNSLFVSVGVDNKLYSFKERNINNRLPKLLCVANNGTIADPFEDRKGFLPAIAAAQELNLDITIAGPTKNNKNFFLHHNPTYDKLNIVYDKNETDLIKIFHEHDVFLHLSNIETGHPNMTMAEALSTGLPVVGTYWGGNLMSSGLLKTKIQHEEIVEKIKKVLNNYYYYNVGARIESLNYDWSIIGNKFLNLYSSYINNFYRTSKFEINSKEIYQNKLNYIYNSDFVKQKINHKKHTLKTNIKVNFINSGSIEINHRQGKKTKVRFTDIDTNIILFETLLNDNAWAKTNREYYTKYRIEAFDEETNELIFKHEYNAERKKVLISFESSALGDTLAWFPYILEFKKKHNCILIVSTFHNDLFKKLYSEIEFVEPGSMVYDLYAMYKIGIFEMENKNIHKIDPRTIPLQKVAADILGIEYKEIKPNIHVNNIEKPIQDKYVCIGTESTAQAKFWNNPNGWQSVIDYLNLKGYKVVSLANNPKNDLKNIIDINNQPLNKIIQWINGAEFFIGLGSGLSWLAWTLNKKVILISGFSHEFSEFYTPHRIKTPSGFCTGCFNDKRYLFTKEWDWCPVNKNTTKMYECSKQISAQSVIDEINKLV
jgi:autotransporter strand-loop-strand O-heptosyltransferase